MEKRTTTLDVEKIKELLIYSWQTLLMEIWLELIDRDSYPRNTIF